MGYNRVFHQLSMLLRQLKHVIFRFCWPQTAINNIYEVIIYLSTKSSSAICNMVRIDDCELLTRNYSCILLFSAFYTSKITTPKILRLTLVNTCQHGLRKLWMLLCQLKNVIFRFCWPQTATDKNLWSHDLPTKCLALHYVTRSGCSLHLTDCYHQST